MIKIASIGTFRFNWFGSSSCSKTCAQRARCTPPRHFHRFDQFIVAAVLIDVDFRWFDAKESLAHWTGFPAIQNPTSIEWPMLANGWTSIAGKHNGRWLLQSHASTLFHCEIVNSFGSTRLDSNSLLFIFFLLVLLISLVLCIRPKFIASIFLSAIYRLCCTGHRASHRMLVPIRFAIAMFVRRVHHISSFDKML